ncbi:hypothetical protein TVAG_104070 [Trichomonas vaginalis G3]|uniref:Uncharacterized protein n=1 Tax=Trichomonas vaginalis (strain ATCC PRA-98 / G3) TaxID=412133 RepID=A2FN46_TRIV3|nr:bifunctional inhibitor/lipid-transfer protein/seed storage 2s albumin superfamily protein family [Trichomonas vaginalis G3]EAX93688.1 hypothetical protein TVAG_104070 [Trichomonas vaginalis G3]KAI5540891.1 bifunctional inhibitor/lipid-transfer protein/seed storage 2s albumin superfamily protein family [Trichomonas vaginalis G3]|eukprot:XP_001306618.1 hypothetical protein [Trichomonas vaginalis G3]
MRPSAFSHPRLKISDCKISNFANKFLQSNPGNTISFKKSYFNRFTDSVIYLDKAADNAIWNTNFNSRSVLDAEFKCVLCTFSGITFSGSGAAIFSYSWNTKIFTSNISNCVVTGNGGGLCVQEAAKFVVDSVIFTSCSAGGTGGCLYYTADAVQSNLRLRRIIFQDSNAGNTAGGCYVRYFQGQTALIYLMFKNCTATTNPQSCYVNGDSIAIETIYLYSEDKTSNINISKSSYDIYTLSDGETKKIIKEPSATYSPYRTAFETPFQTAWSTAFETPYETVVTTPFTTAFETPFSTAHTTNAITPFETPHFTTPFETPYTTPASSPTLHPTNQETPFNTPFSTAMSTAYPTVFRTMEPSPVPTRSLSPTRSPFPPTSMFTPSAEFSPQPTETAYPTASATPRRIHWSALGIALLVIALLFILIGLIANLILCMRIYETCDRIIEPEM